MSKLAKPHNFRVVHRYGVTTTPKVILCLNTGSMIAAIKKQSPHIIVAKGLTFHILKHQLNTNHSLVIPYEGNWPRLTFWFKRALEVFA